MAPVCEMGLIKRWRLQGLQCRTESSYQKGERVAEHKSGTLLFPGINLRHILLLEAIDVVVVQNLGIPVH